MVTEERDWPIPAGQVWKIRADLKNHIRHFFQERDYLEVDTPALVSCPGTEAHLEYFSTDWRDYQGNSRKLWLRSSPELHMKQVLAQGPGRIFQFATSFRNKGELSPWHHPEFCMLEWYQAGIEFDDYISQSLSLIREAWEGIAKAHPDVVRGIFPAGVLRMSVAEAFREFAGVELTDRDPGLAKKGREKGCYSLTGEEDFETAFFKILLDKVEPGLKNLEAVVLYGYPPSQAALARVADGKARRFEIYWRGVELCNGFHELQDPALNQERIREANFVRKQEGRDVPDEDRDFYLALEKGIPDCCGNALGFDRLLTLILGRDNIGSVLPLRGNLPWRDYSHESGTLQ